MNTNINTSAWEAFLDAAFDGDTADIERLQSTLHEAVHGLAASPPVILIWSEERAAGKSTLVRTLRKALGESTSIIFKYDVRERFVQRVLDESSQAEALQLGTKKRFVRPAQAVVAELQVPVIDIPAGPRIHDFEVIGSPDFVLGDLDAELELIREWATGLPAEHRAA